MERLALMLVFPAVLMSTVLATVMLKTRISDNKILSQDFLSSRNKLSVDQKDRHTEQVLSGHFCTDKKNQPIDDFVTLIHGNINKRIRKEASSPYPSFLDPSTTILSTKTLPNERFMPTIGNGHVATVVHSDTIYANAVYNGRDVQSHRARIPATCSVNIINVSSAVQTVDYSLDLGRGIYTETYSSQAFSIELKMYAHQVLNRLLVTEIAVSNTNSNPLVVELSQNLGNESEDIEFESVTKDNIRIMEGYPKEVEYDTSKRVFVSTVSSVVPKAITIPPRQTARHLYLTSVDYDSKNASDYFTTGIQSFMNDTLEKTHVLAWEDIWRSGRIDMEGNKTISQINYASLYYILSGIPRFESGETFVGLSPGDLAHGGLNMDYEGHVFWDQETWMFPPILSLHADKGKTLIKTRVRTHAAARAYALSRGYEGAMFPWESAYTGLNVCPSTSCSLYEQHITGDIAFAIQQYIMMTNDTNFLRYEGGAELINDIALFWASRIEYNGVTKQYYINNIMPPDEYHFPVNNSGYTNCIASLALMLPAYALPLINVKPAHAFEDIANNIFILFDPDSRWHPEFDSYQYDSIVKQADIILLGFPLNLGLAEDVREHDLTIYEAVTPGGPAMTWGMFAIGWLELNEMDKAMQAFERQFLNNIPPFNVWSEEPKGKGAVNFITGMGGYLQSIIFGFGGFRMFTDRLDFNPTIPPGISQFNITGLDYLGGSFDFCFTDSSILLNQTAPGNRDMVILFASTQQNRTLAVGKPFQFKKQKASLLPS